MSSLIVMDVPSSRFTSAWSLRQTLNTISVTKANAFFHISHLIYRYIGQLWPSIKQMHISENKSLKCTHMGTKNNKGLICHESESSKIWVGTHLFLPLGQKEMKTF